MPTPKIDSSMPTTEEMEFSRRLINGRIAEVVFERMMLGEKRYDVIPFGYEHTIPMLAQHRHHGMVNRVIERIADAPDFVLISKDQDKDAVYLVEVKYRSFIKSEEILEKAKEIHGRWSDAWLVVATPEKFYCTRCSLLLEQGYMNEMSDKWVAYARQEKYLSLMNEFRSKK